MDLLTPYLECEGHAVPESCRQPSRTLAVHICQARSPELARGLRRATRWWRARRGGAAAPPRRRPRLRRPRRRSPQRNRLPPSRTGPSSTLARCARAAGGRPCLRAGPTVLLPRCQGTAAVLRKSPAQTRSCGAQRSSPPCEICPLGCAVVQSTVHAWVPRQKGSPAEISKTMLSALLQSTCAQLQRRFSRLTAPALARRSCAPSRRCWLR